MAGRIQIDLSLSKERGAERSARDGLGATQRFVLRIGAVRLMVAMFRPVYEARPAPPGEAGWIRILTAVGRTLWKPASVTDQIAIPADGLRCNPIKNGRIRTDQNAVQLTPRMRKLPRCYCDCRWGAAPFGDAAIEERIWADSICLLLRQPTSS